MNFRAKSPTLGLRPAFASTASRRSAARGLDPKSVSQSTASRSFEKVAAEVLERIEILIAQAQARIAAYDAGKLPLGGNLDLLPSLTSAFATRRAVFGAFDGEYDNG